MLSLDFYPNKEGIQQVQEALEIYERLNDVPGQTRSLRALANILHDDWQLDVAEGVASQVINRFSGKGEQYNVCLAHSVLGAIYRSKGEAEKALDHYETALGIASGFNWRFVLVWVHYAFASLSFDKDKFDDAHTHIERAKLLAVNDGYYLGRMVEHQAQFWYNQGKFEEARTAASHAAEVYERVGATKDVEDCRRLLRKTDEATKGEV